MKIIFSSLDWSIASDGTSSRADNCRVEGISLCNLTTCQQTHGHNVAIVGSSDVGHCMASADALVSNVPGVLLGVLTADCVPILLYDTRHHVAAAIHSGWRGTAQNIVMETITTMQRFFDTRPGDIVASVGPHIRQSSYAVGKEVVDAIGEKFAVYTSDGRYLLSLTQAVADQLRCLGVSRIEDCGIDTYTNKAWPSYRRDKTSRRLMSIIEV